MLSSEEAAAAYGWPIPRRANTSSLLGGLTVPLRLYKWARRALIVRRLEDIIGARYNLMGCAVMYRTSAYRELPRPVFGGSRDTFHSWLLQARGYRIAMLTDATVYLVYGSGEEGLRYYVSERFRWSRGGYQALIHLGPMLLKLRMFRLLLIALLGVLVPIKYSATLLAGVLMLVMGYPDFLFKLAVVEAFYYALSIALTSIVARRLKLEVSTGLIVVGALLHYFAFKWVDALLTLYTLTRTLWERATGQWRYVWRMHKR
jgi:cellulose synthase/poly-beta-1,6-N-acetylglucosamine synthase-like glycosyltransferase